MFFIFNFFDSFIIHIKIALAPTNKSLEIDWAAGLAFAKEYGNSFDINNFIALANANPAAQSISRDLLVGASAIFIWIVNESKKLNMKNMWIVYIGTFLIAFAFSAPFFLFLRERRIIELENIN